MRLAVVGLLAASMLVWSCKEAGFDTGSGKQFSGGRTPAQGATPTLPGNPSDPTFGNRAEPQNGLNGLPSDLPGGIQSLQDCAKVGIEQVNIVLILDASGSQDNTDPSKVRGTAAIEFVRKMNEQVAAGNAPRVSFATVYFNSAASVGPNRWVDIDGKGSAERAVTDINMATSSTGGGTKYVPPLESAAQLLREKGTSSAKDTHRNFVVFLTDGKPSGGESDLERQVSLERLLSEFDSAVIGIAAGSGVDDDDVGEVQALAKPTSNFRKPKHVGQYIRAAQSADIQQAFQSIFDRISKCS